MSKRLGNVIDPQVAADQFGADVLRYWVAGVNWENDAPCSDALLKQFGESYRTVRNTLRFLLSNLYDFTPDLTPTKLEELDEWIVEQTDLLITDCIDAYERFQFGAVIGAVHNFCAKELSKFYLDAIKDRMYCDGAEWPTRRSGQAACYQVLVKLVKIVAPILSHTAEETWKRVPGVDPSVSIHTELFDSPSDDRLSDIEASPLQVKYATLKGIRDDVFVRFEAWKVENGMKNSQDAFAVIAETGEALVTLSQFEPYELANLFKMSWVEIVDGEPSVEFRRSEYLECERSRLRRPDVDKVVVDHEEHLLTVRDRKALNL